MCVSISEKSHKGESRMATNLDIFNGNCMVKLMGTKMAKMMWYQNTLNSDIFLFIKSDVDNITYKSTIIN